MQESRGRADAERGGREWEVGGGGGGGEGRR